MGSFKNGLFIVVVSAAFACSSATERPGATSGPMLGSGGPTGAGTESNDDGGSDETAESSGATQASDGGAPKLDVADANDSGTPCLPDDICCLEEGELPPHLLLDAFVAAYPAALMPKSHPEVLAFMPMADDHAMAFNLDNTGDEFIDPGQGGVTVPNIEAGRAYSKMSADQSIPVTATVLDVREDPVVIEDLSFGGGTGCIGVGWGWGSILFETEDGSIREVVYLYVGYCFDGDAEAFFYSEESVEVCAPPA